ncbi:MAG: Endonuclease MutS2 [Phycisphaerae bacterium]|nr:Endonuclease MutS2 [Phycisphaerae bacterium]
MDAHTLECLDFARIRELLAGYAMCGLGRGLALSIRPGGRLEVVRRWLVQVEEMQRYTAAESMPPFGGISDVRELVRRSAPPLRLSVEEIADVGRTLQGGHAVVGWLSRVGDELPELKVLVGRVGDFVHIAERIARVIDERGSVRDNASEKLARIRARIADAAAAIRQVVHKLLAEPGVTKYLQYHNHTFHNDRIVLPVRAECRGRVAGIIHRSSDSGATVYVEPAPVVELNNEISRLRADEDEEVARLLWELAHEVHINAEAILTTLDTLAVIDLIVAKVRFSRDFDARCPALNDDGRIVLRGARHPLLLDLARRRSDDGRPIEDVVPIDVRVGDDFDMLIITGPNTGGKTVTLKTVGLLCVMVQAGIPIPVGPGCDVGLFPHVMIDVGDEQSMQQSLSTFSAHLTRQLDMMRRANNRTLVLIDELGAGTDPDEGAAIGRAILDEFGRRDSRCIVSTHLGALKGYALTRQRVENGCVEFDIETLRPTYHLRIGEPGNSNAIEIAQRLGLPRRLVAAARNNLSRKGRALREAIAGTVESKRRAEAARAAAHEARVAADDARSAAENARARFAQQQSEFHEWVRHVVHLRPGDAVRVRNFDRDGRVVRVHIEQHRAEIDVGAFAVDVPLGDVFPPQAPPPPPPLERPAAERPTRLRPQRLAPDRPPRNKANSAAGAARGGKPRSTHPTEEDRRPKPVVPSLTDSEAETLKAGDTVLAKRFHRNGRVVRVVPARKVVVVSVGALELELPYSGLALPEAVERARRAAESPPPYAPPSETGGTPQNAPLPEAG